MSTSSDCPPWYWNPNLGYDTSPAPFPPMTSINRLPKPIQRVGAGQAQAFYQLFKSSDGSLDRQSTKRIHTQTTGWDAPSYMNRSTNPSNKPFSRLQSSNPVWSPAHSVEALEPNYGSSLPQTLPRAGEPITAHPLTPWNAWETWNVY